MVCSEQGNLWARPHWPLAVAAALMLLTLNWLHLIPGPLAWLLAAGWLGATMGLSLAPARFERQARQEWQICPWGTLGEGSDVCRAGHWWRAMACGPT